MATIADAVKQVERDPVVGYVSIPVIAAQAPAKAIIVKLKGHQLKLPDWSAAEWAWYGELALKIATKQDAANPTGERDKARAIDRFRPLHDAMLLLAGDSGPPPIERVAPYYDAAVRVVIASNAAASGPSRGRLAAEAFGAAVTELPSTLLGALTGFLHDMTMVSFSNIVKATKAIIKSIFTGSVTGIAAGLGLSSGALVAIGLIGAYLYFKGDSNGEEA